MNNKTRFRRYDPDQLFLLPPDMKEWLPEGDLAYFMMDVVRGLDLGAIYNDYNGTAGGQPPYDPEMMVSLLLYGYCVGIPSSRKLERATHDSVSFRVLSANQHPDHDTIASFRQRHLKALSKLFVSVADPVIDLDLSVADPDPEGRWDPEGQEGAQRMLQAAIEGEVVGHASNMGRREDHRTAWYVRVDRDRRHV